MSIVEIEAAISQLPAADIDRLMSWLKRYRDEGCDGKIADDAETDRFDSLIAEAYARGEPLPLTKADINEARRIVIERITARTSAR